MSNQVTVLYPFSESANYTKYQIIVSESYAQLSSSISESIKAGDEAITGLTHPEVNQVGSYIDNTPILPAMTMSGWTEATWEFKVSWPAQGPSKDGSIFRATDGSNIGINWAWTGATTRYLLAYAEPSSGGNAMILFATESLDSGSSNDWIDIATVIKSGHQELFIGGVSVGSSTETISPPLLAQEMDWQLGLSVPDTGVSDCSMSIKEFRISDKVLYNGNYTPSESYTETGNTQLLFVFHGEPEGFGSFITASAGTGTYQRSIDKWITGSTSPTTQSHTITSTDGDIYTTLPTDIFGGAVLYNLSASFGVTQSAVVTYQVRNQNDPWLIWDTGSSVWASASYNLRNDLATLNTNLLTFPLSGSFNVRVLMDSDGSTNTQLDSLTLEYFTGSCGTGVLPSPTAETDWYLRNLTLSHIQGSPSIIKT